MIAVPLTVLICREFESTRFIARLLSAEEGAPGAEGARPGAAGNPASD